MYMHHPEKVYDCVGSLLILAYGDSRWTVCFGLRSAPVLIEKSAWSSRDVKVCSLVKTSLGPVTRPDSRCCLRQISDSRQTFYSDILGGNSGAYGREEFQPSTIQPPFWLEPCLKSISTTRLGGLRLENKRSVISCCHLSFCIE